MVWIWKSARPLRPMGIRLVTIPTVLHEKHVHASKYSNTPGAIVKVSHQEILK